ncbi:MAG: tRNA (adenosine(37)-N6)-threonylcarbamoyltransferase complex dimerization subunit type 1 TsaB [Solirubrobacteraceae bacterium]
MIVLGFDTATPATAVGLMLDDGRVLEGRDDPPAGERPGHSTRLLGLALDLLRQASIDWRDVERLAVGVGPGTFTGLRIGVASARGLAQSLDVELVGVSSLRALALAASRSCHDRVLSLIDARRGEVFLAAHRSGEELLAPQPLPPERLGEALERAGIRRVDEWVAVGDGALRFACELEKLGVSMPAVDSPLHRVSARAICELATGSPVADTPVLPSYCRVPDAEASLQGAPG